jgi:two-component system chemotaxis response regulator CheY
MKILVMDDSEMVKDYYHYILKNAGLDGITVMDGGNGSDVPYRLSNFGVWYSDVVHSDVDLISPDGNAPDINVYNMIDDFEEKQQAEDRPIHIISTKSGPVSKNEGDGIGVDVYIGRPIDPNILVQNIRLLMGA